MKRSNALDDLLLRRARAMRKDPASAEKKLWQLLRNRQLDGVKFRRQHRAGCYIADFYCADARLVVELDGDSHGDRAAYDERRTRRLQRDGKHVIRFVNDDVFWHTDAVLETIYEECVRLSEERKRRLVEDPHPDPLPEYREREKRPSPRPSPGVPGEGEMRAAPSEAVGEGEKRCS